jgi:hypothetical protein
MAQLFDLHVLGWKAFEDLVGCIFRDILGQTVQIFAEGADGGRDAAFRGIWSGTSAQVGLSGSFCIQCKHTSKPTQKLSMSTVAGELKKVKRLTENGLCDNYILVTNHQLPATVSEKAEKAIVSSGAKVAHIYGTEWISKVISENPKLRRLVPRLYGLGDLTQIITHQAYRQAREVLDSIAPDLACFVPTASYRKCAVGLREHGFVLLLGEPASGKTMIANLMALSAADEWGIETIMISSPADFSKFWDPDDPGQFLWVDDAFGATQYDANRVSEWNQLLPKLKAAIRAGARVAFTSRDYIFAAAKRDLKISAFELFDDSRVLITVEDLTDSERQMILYNHLKTGSQPRKFKREVKEFLEPAAQVPRFLPEIARRFGNPKFTENLIPTASDVQGFFERPLNVLLDVVASLAAAEKAAIGLVFIAGGKLSIPVVTDEHVAGTLELLGVTLGEVKAAFGSLVGSLLKRQKEGGTEYWVFRHPTIRDAYATIVGENPELIDVYLAGVGTDQLLKEVICGDVQLEGAKIIVPQSRHANIHARLDSFPDAYKKPWSNPVSAFLSSRCSADFIASYFQSRDISRCIPGSSWELGRYNPSLQVLAKLNSAGLLSEDVRSSAAKSIAKISDCENSCIFIKSQAVQNILSQEEINSTAQRIAQRVLLGGTDLLEEIKDNWDNESDPEDVFTGIDSTLEFIEVEESFDEESRAKATRLRQTIEDMVRDLEERPVDSIYEELEAEKAEESDASSSRSIFDDVDE